MVGVFMRISPTDNLSLRDVFKGLSIERTSNGAPIMDGQYDENSRLSHSFIYRYHRTISASDTLSKGISFRIVKSGLLP